MRILSSVILLAWASPVWASFLQISDPDTFSSTVVGQVYVDEKGAWFRFNEDGTLSGGAGGQDLTGNWSFQRGMACFNRALGGEALPSDCIVILVDGNQLVTVREQGKGRQTVYTRQ